jgi:hypothetical protein
MVVLTRAAAKRLSLQRLEERRELEVRRRRAWENERFQEIPPLDLQKSTAKPGGPTAMLFKLLAFGTLYMGARILCVVAGVFLFVRFCELSEQGLKEAMMFIS